MHDCSPYILLRDLRDEVLKKKKFFQKPRIRRLPTGLRLRKAPARRDGVARHVSEAVAVGLNAAVAVGGNVAVGVKVAVAVDVAVGVAVGTPQSAKEAPSFTPGTREAKEILIY